MSAPLTTLPLNRTRRTLLNWIMLTVAIVVAVIIDQRKNR